MANTPELFPVFTPQLGDVNQLNKHVVVIDMSAHRNPAAGLGEAIEDFLVSPDIAGGNPNLIRYRDRLNNGGTLITREVSDLVHQYREAEIEMNALKNRLGHSSKAPMTIKSYRGRVAGLAPHRDANFNDSGPASVVDAMGLRGQREFALWAIPQNIELDDSDANFMHRVDRTKAIVEFIASLDGRPYTFRPTRMHTFGPGQGVRIDEKRGEWKQPAPSNRIMAVWHSVHGLENEDGRPTLTAVIRSSNPRKLPPKK